MFRWAIAGCFLVILVDHAARTSRAEADDWPQWRGPTSNNHAARDADPPIEWNIERGKNVVWKTAVPGRGHSSLTVVDDAIYFTAADERADQQSLVILERKTGAPRRVVTVHQGGLPERMDSKHSHASPTVASDGEYQFVVFHNNDAIRLTVIDRLGRVVWRRDVCEFPPTALGYLASPTIEEDLVIIAAESDSLDSGIYAFDKRTGRKAWKAPRPLNLSFSSPIVAQIAGRRQLLLPGARQVQSFDPRSGRKLWAADASTKATCGTICWDHRTIFLSGGRPDPGIWAVLADGSGKVLWENQTMCYEQSLLAVNGYLYAVSDDGVAYCWKANDGTEMWKQRLGGNYNASPMLVDDRIYFVNESGEVFVIRETPARFQLLAKNRLGDHVFATPVAIGNRLYVRYASDESGRRREYVAALGR